MLESPESVRIADGRKLDAVAYGSVRLKMYREKSEIQTTLKRVLHVHTMSCNLLSAGAITDNGFRVILEESETLAKLKEFVASVTGETGEKIGILRTDNGGEYTSREFRRYLIENKIEHETSSPNSPEQNGIAERMNRTLIEKAKAMIVHAGLPKFYLAEAVNTAVYLTNRIPTKVLGGDITPFEKW